MAHYISQLNYDVSIQGFSAIGLLLGQKFLNLGLREIDRDIIERLKVYKSLIREKILERLVDEQEKIEKKEKIDQNNIISILFKEGHIDLNQKKCLMESKGEKYGVEEILD